MVVMVAHRFFRMAGKLCHSMPRPGKVFILTEQPPVVMVTVMRMRGKATLPVRIQKALG